jgi:hypothetical protein
VVVVGAACTLQVVTLPVVVAGVVALLEVPENQGLTSALVGREALTVVVAVVLRVVVQWPRH